MSEDRYREAGVDIDAQNRALAAVADRVRATFTAGVRGDFGGFGGVFDPGRVGAVDALLVASTDGVGTKAKVAAAARRYDTIGSCLVNHCVDDILVQGARPLFFLDYVGTGRLEPEVVAALIGGVADACRMNRCALLGGETAEMPGTYPAGEFELVGTIVGFVPRERLIDGSRVRAGDAIVALPANGLHTNGYSLARKVLFEELGYGLETIPPGADRPLADLLLEVHPSYLPAVEPLLDDEWDALHAMCHVTGGGVVDNLPRVLPEGLAAELDRDAVRVPGIVQLVVEAGGLTEAEAYRVFNMGFGFLLIVADEAAARIVDRLRDGGSGAVLAGRIVEGEHAVVLV